MKKFSRKSRGKNTKKVQDEIYKPSVEEEFIRSFSGSDVKKAQLITYSNIFHSSANTKSVRKFAFFTKGESKKVRYWMTPKLFIISLNIETPPIDENYFISHKFYDDKYVSFHLNPAACTNMIYFMDKVTDVLSKLEFFNRIILLTDDSNLDPYLYESICKSSIQNYSQFVEFPIAVPCSVEELKQINHSADSESHYSSTPSNVYKLTKEDGQLDYSTTQKSQNQLSEIQDDSESSPSLFISPPSTDESQVNSDFKAAAKMKDMYLQSTSQESAVSVSSSFRSSAGRRSTSVRPRKRNTDNSTNNRASRSSINSRASQNDTENQHASNPINKKNRNSINSTASTSSRNRRNLSVTQKHRGRGNRNSISSANHDDQNLRSNRNSINSTDNGDESEKANRASARNRRSNRNSINSSINENDIDQNHRSNRNSMNSANNISSNGSRTRRSGSVKKIIIYDNNENIEDNTNEISQNGQRSRKRRNRNSIDNDEYSNKYDMYSTSSRHSKANDNEDDRYDMINTTNIRRTKHRQTRNNEIEIEYDEEDIIQRSSSRHNRNHGNEIKDDRDEENENKYEMYSTSSKNSRHRKNSVRRSNSRNRRSSSTTQKAKEKNNIDINENVNQTNSPISHTVKNRRRSKSISNTYDGSSHKKNIIGNSNSNINNSNSSNNKRNSFNGNSNNRRKIINYTSDNIDHNYKGSSLMTNTLRLVNSENNFRRNRNEIKETKEAHSEEESSGDNFTFDISNDEIEEMQRKKNSNTNTNDSSTFESRKKNQDSIKQVSVLQIQSDGTSSITKTAPDLKMNHNRRKVSSYNESEGGNKIVTHQVIRKANSSFHKVVKKTKVRKNLSLDLDEESSFDNPKHALSSLTNSSKYLNENPDNSEFRAINSDDTTSEEEEISGSQKNSISNRSNEYDSIDAAVPPLESDSHSSRRRRK